MSTFFDMLPVDLINKVNTYKRTQYKEYYEYIKTHKACEHVATLHIVKEDARAVIALQLNEQKKNTTLDAFLRDVEAGKPSEMFSFGGMTNLCSI